MSSVREDAVIGADAAAARMRSSLKTAAVNGIALLARRTRTARPGGVPTVGTASLTAQQVLRPGSAEQGRDTACQNGDLRAAARSVWPDARSCQ
jgi:hypothetical protein